MKKLVLFLLAWLGVSSCVWAQDPQFSQFYANQVLLTPAFTGAADAPRMAVNGRSQWSAITGAWKTMGFAFDMPVFFGPTEHGLGISFMADQAGAGNLTKLDIMGNYSYKLQIARNHVIRFGLQAGIMQASIDAYKLRFPNQFNPIDGFDPNLQSGENISQSRTRFDMSVGALYYNKSRFWFGFNVAHITQPEERFTDAANAVNVTLPMKMSVFTGIALPIDDEGTTISPSLMFRNQGPFNQLDMGAYVNLDPMVFGVYYRVFSKDSPFRSDALIGLVGVEKGRFRIGYSYDYTVSNAKNKITGGSHEVSLVVTFDPLKRKQPKHSVNMSCPKF